MGSFNDCIIDDLHNHIGKFIANDVYDPETGRLLIRVNNQISEPLIESLKKRGIDFVFICDRRVDLTEDSNEIIQANSISSIRNVSSKIKTSFYEIADDLKHQIALGNTINIDDELLKKVELIIEELINKVANNPASMIFVDIIDSKDPYLLRHSVNVTYLTVCLAVNSLRVRNIIRNKEQGLGRFSIKHTTDYDPIVPLGVSCLLHDIGKILILDTVNKDTTFAHDNEVWKAIRQHPKNGYDMLFGKNVDSHSLLGIKYHHENFDGTGYPFGIKDYKIHVFSRIIRVIDSFDAATTDRPGKRGKSKEEVINEMKTLTGTHYDPEIVEHFLKLFE
jgi:HD-GYP domain-containing protein (c-di-GMP phosphodiesterase class II)